MSSDVHHAPLRQLHPLTLHGILRVRSDVFVVEQDCAYPDLDDVDTAPETVHWWVEQDGRPVSTLRTYLDDDGAAHLGRVATHSQHRGQGHSGRLLQAALDFLGDQPVIISAQAHLERWYGSFGFVRQGEGYLEDGIPHLKMVRRP